MSDKISSLRPVTATKRAGCRTASELSPASSTFCPPTLPSLPLCLKYSPLPERIPPGCIMQSGLSKSIPDRSASSWQKGPFPYFPKLFQRPGSKRERERKTPAPSLPSFPPLPWSYGMPHFTQPPDNDGDFHPDLKKRFFGDGESTRGEGAVFTKNAPSPLAGIFLCPATAGGSCHPPGPRWPPRRARLQGYGSAGGSAGLPAPGDWCSAG